MIPNIVMLTTFTLLLLNHRTSTSAFAAPSPFSPSILGAECTFTTGQFKYDLCPLFQSHKSTFRLSFVEETPPTRTENIYTINLAEPIKRDGTLPSELQCPIGTQICLTVQNTRPNHPSEPTRILQVVPIASVEGLRPKAKLLVTEKGENEKHAPLQLTLHGGSYISHRQKASFRFLCDEGASEPTSPTFLYSFNGTHAFEWKSKHACHEPLPVSAPPAEDEHDDDPAQDPPEDPDQDSDREPGPSPGMTGSGQAVVLVFIFIILYSLVRAFRSSPYYVCRRLGHTSPRRIWHTFTSSISPLLSIVPSWYRHATSNPTSTSRDSSSYIFDYDDDDIGRDADRPSEEVPLTPSTPGFIVSGKGRDGGYGSFGR